MKRYTDSEALAALEAIDPATTPSFTRGNVAAIAAAAAERDDAERRILDAVREARARRVPWTMIASARAARLRDRHTRDGTLFPDDDPSTSVDELVIAVEQSARGL